MPSLPKKAVTVLIAAIFIAQSANLNYLSAQTQLNTNALRAMSMAIELDPNKAIIEKVKEYYAEKGINADDYYVPPIVGKDIFGKELTINKGDIVIHANHRADRVFESLFSLTDPDFNKDSQRFDTPDLGLHVVAFANHDSKYFAKHGIEAAFTINEEDYRPSYDSLVDVLYENNIKQGYFTETDKGKHVSYFLAGQRNLPYEDMGIHVEIVASQSVSDKEKDPNMQYKEITSNAINFLQNNSSDEPAFILVNYPVDIQGHNIKCNKQRAIDTISACDREAEKLYNAVKEMGGVWIDTSDHGNVEELAVLDKNGMPVTDKYGNIPYDQHTANSVHCIIDGLGNVNLKDGKGLANIAPTVLEILGIDKPKDMEESLLKDYKYKKIKGPVVVVVRDGWGKSKFTNPEALEWNGLELAKPAFFNRLKETAPITWIKAHGSAVGLPDYQEGDSDNGHRTIGAGKILPTLYKLIIDQIESGDFYKNEVLRNIFKKAIEEKHDICVMGLDSDGGIHCDHKYFLALIEMARCFDIKKHGIKLKLFPILDGRDRMTRIYEQSGAYYLEDLDRKIKEAGLAGAAYIAQTVGRYMAMDRDAVNADKERERLEQKLSDALKPDDPANKADNIVKLVSGITASVTKEIAKTEKELAKAKDAPKQAFFNSIINCLNAIGQLNEKFNLENAKGKNRNNEKIIELGKKIAENKRQEWLIRASALWQERYKVAYDAWVYGSKAPQMKFMEAAAHKDEPLSETVDYSEPQPADKKGVCVQYSYVLHLRNKLKKHFDTTTTSTLTAAELTLEEIIVECVKNEVFYASNPLFIKDSESIKADGVYFSSRAFRSRKSITEQNKLCKDIYILTGAGMADVESVARWQYLFVGNLDEKILKNGFSDNPGAEKVYPNDSQKLLDIAILAAA
ncbi:MAG: hypothetical protein V2A72_05580 [Candidatus Omnitrophota bacterium]